jgi:hypothetical protein
MLCSSVDDFYGPPARTTAEHFYDSCGNFLKFFGRRGVGLTDDEWYACVASIAYSRIKRNTTE